MGDSKVVSAPRKPCGCAGLGRAASGDRATKGVPRGQREPDKAINLNGGPPDGLRQTLAKRVSVDGDHASWYGDSPLHGGFPIVFQGGQEYPRGGSQ